MGKIFHFAFVVMVTTAIATGILASLNFATQGRIKEMDLKTQMEARKSALPESVKFDEKKSIKCGNSSFIPGYNQNGEITGYVSTVKARGYGANGIVFVLGVRKELSLMKAIMLLTASSTFTISYKVTFPPKAWYSIETLPVIGIRNNTKSNTPEVILDNLVLWAFIPMMI